MSKMKTWLFYYSFSGGRSRNWSKKEQKQNQTTMKSKKIDQNYTTHLEKQGQNDRQAHQDLES